MILDDGTVDGPDSRSVGGSKLTGVLHSLSGVNRALVAMES